MVGGLVTDESRLPRSAQSRSTPCVVEAQSRGRPPRAVTHWGLPALMRAG